MTETALSASTKNPETAKRANVRIVRSRQTNCQNQIRRSSKTCPRETPTSNRRPNADRYQTACDPSGLATTPSGYATQLPAQLPVACAGCALLPAFAPE